MPVEARAADRHRRRAISALVLRVGGAAHRRHMAMHAVVVVEKAVANVERGFRGVDAEVGQLRPGLRRRKVNCGNDRKRDHRQQSDEHCGPRTLAIA